MNIIENNKPYFDKKTTDLIKGVALLFIMLHHFFGFPEWLLNTLTFPESANYIVSICAGPLKICVPMFCFITGYFYYFNKDKTYKYSFKKITDVLIYYWIIFLILYLIAKYIIGYNYTTLLFVLEMISINRPTMNFCWYVPFFIMAMLLLPLLVKILGKNIIVDIILIILIIPGFFGILYKIFPNLIISDLISDLYIWISCVLIGYFVALYDLFNKLDIIYNKIIKNKVLSIVIPLLFLILILFLRDLCSSFLCFNLDNIYAPLFIYFIIKIYRIIDLKPISFVFRLLGKYSLPMWFISCMFYDNCRSIFQPLLYFSNDFILITIWGLFILLVLSIIIDFVVKKIIYLKNKYIFKLL